MGDDEALLAAEEVPVGGGVVLADRRIVVTQPEPGVFRAFSAVCPHRECVVRRVVAGAITCLCHGSRFRVDDGSVIGGPSPGPLPEREVVVVNGTVRLAPNG